MPATLRIRSENQPPRPSIAGRTMEHYDAAREGRHNTMCGAPFFLLHCSDPNKRTQLACHLIKTTPLIPPVSPKQPLNDEREDTQDPTRCAMHPPPPFVTDNDVFMPPAWPPPTFHYYDKPWHPPETRLPMMFNACHCLQSHAS